VGGITPLNTKVLYTLEYNKIIERLTEAASTALGKALTEQLLPSKDFEEVKQRLQETDEASLVIRLKGQPPFGGIRQVNASLRRSEIGGMLSAEELLDVSTTVSGGRRLKRFLAVVHEDHKLSRLAGLFADIAELRQVDEAISSCIDEQGEVMDSASPELARVRRERRTGEGRVKEKLDQMIRTPSIQKMLQDNLITVRNDRYVIPVKQEYRGSFGGIVHDQSGSGATLFIEPESVVVLNNKLRELSLAERKEIEKVLSRLTAIVAEHAEEIAANLELLAQLDFIFAKAGLAYSMKATRPMMNDRGYLKIRKGKHPLLSGNAVPLDLELGNAYSAIIVTGPNTGGKTVALKTVGLLTLMAAAGLFVPAEDGSQLCVFDAVYADIGDEQSIEQNLSTFSSHMTNIISILQEMTPKSLVLFDELGAGTDPAEGSALAIAMLDHVHKLGSRIIATTHYSELKAYAYDRKGMINASMEFDVQTLSPTYRLLVGVPGRSNAFAIAKRLGLSSEIIEHASSQVGEDDKRVETMIASLEENRLGAESERQTAEKLRLEMEEMKRRFETEKAEFEQRKDELMQQAEQEALSAIVIARKEAETIIADLRKMALEEAGSLKEHKLIEAKKRLDEAMPELTSKASAPSASKKAVKLTAGDEVHVRSLRQKGFVVEVGSAEAMVQLGIMKMKLPISDLEPIKNEPAAKKPKRYMPAEPTGAGLKRTRDDQLRMELDLRGATLEESYMEVDRFLDETFLSGIGQAYIIHGKGTGVLRTGIQEFLRKHKHVKSYRLGNYGEGGAGVTVVEFT
jgi:DNA mismatch repair protein MutS2